MRSRLRWVSMPEGHPQVEIPDDIYIQAKRTALTAGITPAELYLCRKFNKTRSDNSGLLASFYKRLEADSNRDDIKLGKCMHCIFRKSCTFYPNARCPHMDDRFRKLGTTFKIIAEDLTEKVLYDCGWVRYEGKTPRNIFRKALELPPITRRMRVEIMTPFSGGLTKNHILPNKLEIYERYCKRVKRYEEEIHEALSNNDKSVEENFKMIINKIGQHDTLMNDYGGSLELMLQDYWPYQTMREVVDLYTHGTAIPIKEFIDKAKKELQQAKKEEEK